MRYHFLDALTLGLVPEDAVVSDYHPLTKEGIAGLLTVAQSTTDPATINSIHIRLCQGIEGYTSPRPRRGVIAAYERAVSELYLSSYHLGADPDVVAYLYALMTHAIRLDGEEQACL
jgi:hypothetical protein